MANVQSTHPKIEVNVEEQLAYYKNIRDLIVELTGDTICFTNDAFDMGKKILVEGEEEEGIL